MSLIETIRQLEKEGVLGPEQVPEPDYWHWPVLEPEKLPPFLVAQWLRLGEIRWSAG